MALSRDGKEDAADGGSAAPTKPEPTCTIYECVYPDADRRRSGEPADEAVSRAFFGSLPDAQAFQRHNGGVVEPKVIPISERRRMERLRLLPNAQPKHWVGKPRIRR